MRQFNAQAIRTYIVKKDRTTPLFFTGRRDEIALAHEALSNLKENMAQGNTIVFQGAPGAGKTALLEHLKETLRSECDTAHLNSAHIHQPNVTLFEVLEELEPDVAAQLRQSRQETVRGGIKAFGLEGGGSVATTTPPVDIPTVRQLMGIRTNQHKPLLLFLDEAQNADGDLPSGKSSILLDLHAGNSGNVSLIAGGLSNTEAQFKRLGISRTASGSVTTLQPLHENEVIHALNAFLDNEEFGIDCHGCDLTPIQQLVVDESMGWPQHLTNALRSLSEELITVNGRLAECDLDAVQHHSQIRREEYYAGRTKTIPKLLLREVVSTVPKGGNLNELDVRKVIERAYQAEPLIAEALPYTEAFDMLVRCGVLQRDATDNLTVPIPSMHDYITERTGPIACVSADLSR